MFLVSPQGDLRGEWKFSSPCGLCWYHGWLGTSLPAVRDENPSSLLDFLTPPSRGTGCPGTAWRRQKPRVPTSLCWRGCGKPLSALVSLGWSVARLISTLCPVLACPFPCPGLEKAGFFLSAPFCHFQVASFFTSKSKAYKAKKKTQGTHYCVIPRVPKSLVGLPSLHLSVLS